MLQSSSEKIQEDKRQQINEAFEAVYEHEKDKENPEIQLLKAIKEGRLDEVRNFTEKGYDLNTKDKINGSTVLHWATFNGRSDIVKYLVEKGADIKGQDGQGDTPVHEAAYWGQLPILKYFAEEKNVDVGNLENNYGEIPLHRAIESDDFSRAENLCKLEVVKYLVENAHLDINKKGPFERTPLHWAAKYDFLDLIKYLIKQGADINAKDDIGYTPLHTAADYGNVPVVKYFVEETKADVNAGNIQGNTPLHMAIICGSSTPDANQRKLDIIKCLVECKQININAKGLIGNTPLHEAAVSGTLNMIMYLVENGADVHAKNEDGDTPLSIAIRQKETEEKFIETVEKTAGEKDEQLHAAREAIRKSIQKETNDIVEYLEKMMASESALL